MALDILHDSWGPYTHTEVENALKVYLETLETRINQATQEGGVGLEELSQEVRGLLEKARTSLQPADISAWAKAENKPSYNANEIGGVDGFANLLAKLQAMDTAIASAAESGGDVDLSNYYSKTDSDGRYVRGIKAHGSQTNLPVNNGVVELPESEAGGLTEADIDVSSNMDGTVDFTFGESSYTINLNHTHPQYVVKDELDDYILPGTNVTITKDAQTGALTISASGGGTFNQVQANWNESDTTSAAYIQNKPTIPDVSGKADKSEMSVTAGTGANADKTTIQLKNGTSATVLTTHQSLSGRVQSSDITTIVVCDDETEYNSISNKDSNTLYLIKEGSNA